LVVTFRIAEHSYKPGLEVVEVLVDDKVVGVVFPEEENKIKIISAHFSEKEVPKDFDGEVIEGKESDIVPAIHITFKPRKYTIIGKRIVYLE
jgi:hypothetical protein